MSVVYRLWAGRRIWDLRKWQESWAASGQHAYRPGHSAQDVYWSIALKVEDAVLHDCPLFGISFDYVKCFDMIPHNILFGLVKDLSLIHI
eukprot:4026813-Karenia_brevis.AAC.1